MSDFHRASLEMAWLRLCQITNESTEIENCYVCGRVYCFHVRKSDRPTVCPKRFVSLITSRIIDGISSNFANTFIYTRQILLIKK